MFLLLLWEHACGGLLADHDTKHSHIGLIAPVGTSIILEARVDQLIPYYLGKPRQGRERGLDDT